MPIYMELKNPFQKLEQKGAPGGVLIPVQALGEVQGFSSTTADPPFTQEQVDKAAARIDEFIATLDDDERDVVLHILAQAAGATD